MAVTELERLASERGVTPADIAVALRLLPTAVNARLSSDDEKVLIGLGIDPTERARSPLLAANLLRQELERDCLTAEQAARLLEVNPSRVRQRLKQRTLLGFHRRSGRHEWLLPAFQFSLGLHNLDTWGRLLAALPRADDTSPTALIDWLTRPRPHLAGRSRAQALAEGFDAERLIAEAATYGMPQ